MTKFMLSLCCNNDFFAGVMSSLASDLCFKKNAANDEDTEKVDKFFCVQNNCAVVYSIIGAQLSTLGCLHWSKAQPHILCCTSAPKKTACQSCAML